MPILAQPVTATHPARTKLINFQTGLKKVGNNFEERSRMFSVHDKGAATMSPTKHSWGYETKGGPKSWGGECDVGSRQSPIDIITSPPPTITTNTSQYVFLDYKQGKGLGITNNGRAIVGEGDAFRDHKLTVDSYDYFLKRFTFHRPSEHTIAGQRFALEAQLEHIAPNGKRVMLAILFKEGQENAFLNDLNWKHLPDSPSEGGNGITSDIKLNDLIPGYDMHNFFRYYMYTGSMTTPPCSTWGVRWVIAKHTAQISTEQLSKFPFHNNSRPIQALGDRLIYENAARTSSPTLAPTTREPTPKPTVVPVTANPLGTLAPLESQQMEKQAWSSDPDPEREADPDAFSSAPTVG